MDVAGAVSDQQQELIDHTAVWEDLLLGLRNHKAAIVCVFVTTVVAAYVVLETRTELYESGASLLVKFGRENLGTPVTVSKGSVFTTGIRKEELESEISLILSRDLIEVAVDEIGVETFLVERPKPTSFLKLVKYYIVTGMKRVKASWNDFLIAVNLKKRLATREALIAYLQQNLKASRGRDADVIHVNLRLANPELGTRFLDVLLRLYLDRHVQVRRAPGIKTFFETEVRNFHEQLERLEERKRLLQQEHGISSIGEEKALLLSRLHDLYAELGTLKSEMLMLGVRRGTATSRTTIPPPDSKPVQEQLGKLKIKRVRLGQLYDEDAEVLRNLDDEIVVLEDVLRRGLGARMRHVRVRVATIEAELNQLNAAELELENLEREETLAEQNYFIYEKRREEARINEEFNMRRVANISILSAPSSSFAPVYPRKLLVMAISLPVGMLLAMGFALLLEYFGNMVHTHRDLLGIPGLTYLGEFNPSN